MGPNRLTDQVIWNAIASNLKSYIEDGPNLDWGVDEYFEMWGDGGFPWLEGGALTLHPNSALSDEERRALTLLVDLLNTAAAQTEGTTPEEFLQTEWPARIRQRAAEAFTIMAARGCFSETEEEAEPTTRI